MRSPLILPMIVLSASPAIAQEHPPFTVQFEKTLSAHGQCLREAVDRVDPSIQAKEAAARAATTCETSFKAAQSQLANDYVTRRGFSVKSAARAAARDMRGLRQSIQKTVLEQAEENRRISQ